ncbi:molybdate transport system regulatory protein [Cohaesibacter sp. ES.047]|uniref:TOBE domain-containing protein n=1 Tax=Cohaesibacter sp. ES.047 TaxID=1798205 RepID=UPI000BB8F6F5|nr:TOBE domain-containing protein [Cohaesibacter sp. ES.047]SNY91668.1 molybdate transport system regulatory protein [Cohaesibacter sp. ES.047]
MTKTAEPLPHAIRPVLSFLGKAGQRASEERFRLLSQIDREGSISAAAKAVGISYKGAWDAVHALNNLFPSPLVVTQPGGRKGGGAFLTEEGRKALQAHQYLTERLAAFWAELEQDMMGSSDRAVSPSPLLWSFAMRTSARNVFHGIVESVITGAVHSEVALRVSDRTLLTVILTNKSAESLELREGLEAFALIKASAPVLMIDEGQTRLSARNQIRGAVLSVEDGAVNSEVLIDIGDSKVLTVIITKQSVETLAIKPGEPVCAMIKASQIILGVE